MPLFPCKHPTCTAHVHQRGGYCPNHQRQKTRAEAERHRFYDQHKRDPAAKRFYNSAPWQTVRKLKLESEPVCQRCQATWADTVHHRKPLRECSDVEALDPENLVSLCGPCHSAIEAEAAAAKA